ncbi:hypothetical protein N9I50_01230 [bacterium]|nr:hypothetical protein [bacterium]
MGFNYKPKPTPAVIADEDLVELTYQGYSSAADVLQQRLDGCNDPAVPINRRFPSTNQFEVRCPHCGYCHKHGNEAGHRRGHCWQGDGGSYFVLDLSQREITKALSTRRQDRPVVVEL